MRARALDLLEREPALRTLAAAFEASAAGRGSTQLVSGEAGVGKTSLITCFASTLVGAKVLWGGCEALFTPRPLGPLHDFAADLDSKLPQRLGNERRNGELFTAVLAALAASPMPTLLVIEDLHWADAATLDLVKFLARRMHRVRALLVVTYRDDEIPEGHPLRLVLGDLQCNEATRLMISPLSEAGVHELAARAQRPAEGVYAATGGNPFFVTEVLRSGALPTCISDAVHARMARQAEPVRAVLELASIVPGHIERALIDSILAPEPDTMVAALGSGLLVTDADTYAFRHELARRAIEQSIPPPRARALHSRMLAALDAWGPGSALPRRVHHATAAGDDEAVLRHSVPAAREAASHGAHRESAALYALALERGGALNAPERAHLLEQHAYECYLIGQIPAAIASREAALDIWRTNSDRQAEGRTLRWLSRLNWYGGNNRAAESFADAAISLLGTEEPTREFGWSLSNRAQLHMLAERKAEAIDWGRRAMAIAEQLGDDELLAHALNNIGTAEDFAPGAQGRALLERSLAIALRDGFEEHVAGAYANLSSNALVARDYAYAQTLFEQAASYFIARDLDSWGQYILALNARVEFECGRWEKAEQSASRVIGHCRTAAIVRIPALVVLARLRCCRGDSGATALLDEAATLAHGTGELQRIAPVVVAQCEASWITHRQVDASTELRAAYAQAFALRNQRWIDELGFWLWKAGDPSPTQSVDGPHAMQINGRWRDAADAWAAVGCPLDQAMALLDGDEPALREALVILDGLGASALAAICREQLRTAGARGVPRGPRAETAQNPAGLTARELEILRLVARGLGNAEIARSVVRSEKTIDHHVSAILAKLGVRSRTEAAAVAHEIGILSPALKSF